MVGLGLDVPAAENKVRVSPHQPFSILISDRTSQKVCLKLRGKVLDLRRLRHRGRLRLVTENKVYIKTGDSMLCCGRRKDQGRDIPPNAEPAASPRRLQLGQFASTLPPPGVGRGRELPPMVLQPDFRKVSGISSEIFKQLEAVENDHDATTAAALDAVERRGEMLVRMLDPRNQFSRSRQDLVRRFISMQDGLHTVHFVEIVKRPGQTLGLYIREGNGLDRYDGVFISRIAIESAVFNSGCLGVGDEILAVNLIDVTHMSLDDVVIIMSIPRRLVLTIRQRKGRVMSNTGSLLRPDSSKLPPVVVIKKDLDEEPYEESNGENHLMGHGPHSFSLSQPHQGMGMLGRGRTSSMMSTQGQRIFAQQVQRQQPMPHPSSIQSLPRHASYQHYANLQQLQSHQSQLPDVTDYARRPPSRSDDYSRLEGQAPGRRSQYSEYYDPRSESPTRPSSQQSAYTPSYSWYRSGDPHQMEPMGPSMSYQPPPPVITEQPRSLKQPAHFQQFDRAYPKTLESLAEKVHTFYTGPRPVRQGGRSQIRMPRTGSDHRISLSRTGDAQQWYGSMPRQRTTELRSHQLQQQPQRYSAGLSSARLSIPSRRKPVLDYASDSEAMSYTPSIRSAGLSLPASTRRSLGLSNGRSNSLPRDFIRGRGGRKAGQNVRFDKRGGGMPDLSSMAGRRALLLASGIDSQEESDGAASAPEMPTPRRDRGRIPSSPGVFTSGEYRSWLTRAPSTSAIYERLKTHRDVELLETQRAAKFTFSAENLNLLDRARQRTEREIKRLHDDIDRENQAQSQLKAWEASQAKDQPYYSYRSHLLGLGLSGGDSTLARALAGRSPSASSALASLGLSREPLSMTTSTSLTKDNILASDPLRRLGITPSRSRDLITSLSEAGRSTPTSALLHRISSDREKDSESILLRKEILSRSLINRDLLKDDLDEKPDNIVSRFGMSSSVPPIGGSGTSSGILSRSTLSTPVTSAVEPRLRLLTINPSEFLRYKIERPSSAASDVPGQGTGAPAVLHGHSGILRVHLLAGRALRSTVRATDSSVRTRDLYCVLECDRVHKARTVVCTGDQNFDWDEIFELDLVNNKELDFLIYSWDPQLRHRLCYKGSVNLTQILSDINPNSAFHHLAIKVEPRGTLYVKLKHTPPQEAFKREKKKIGLFGVDVSSVVMREDSGLNVPLIVQKCIEEIERRGLDIIGLYRLCGSASKKQTLREAFERNPRTADLSAENVPDINVIAGVLKDYLRELPEPLLTKCLYQMLVDALGVCLPDDPEGNARLLFSIIECLPKPNRCTLLLILEHLSLVCSLSDRNKMGPTQLATCYGPILMVYFDDTPDSLDFQPTIKVLQYLLEVWPAKSVTMLQTVRAVGAEAVRKGPSLLGKGRPFPRSSPGSALLSKSQRTTSGSSRQAQPMTSQQSSLRLSPTKQSPGSLSESSPSPTSVTFANKTHSGHTFTAAITSSTSSGALTLTPSTTSSSLTSVTTPNSLTPVSSTAKSITPVATTFNSNYSLTSEMSTTSVVMSPSPTPGRVELAESYASPDDIFTSVSVRSRVTAFQGQEPAAGPPVPPSPFPGRKFGGPGHVERSHSVEEREKRRLPNLPQQHSIPPHSSQQQSVPQQHQFPLTQSSQPQSNIFQQTTQQSSPFHHSMQQQSNPQQYSYASQQPPSQYSVPQQQSTQPPQYSTSHQQYSVIGNGGLSHSNVSGSYISSTMSDQSYQDVENLIKQPVKQQFPPPPPPKPGSGQRERDLKKEEGRRDNGLSEIRDSVPLNGSNSPSWMTPTHSSTENGIKQKEVQKSTTATSSTSSTPPTPPGNTPAPPPVPPRLDRRPSQPSPTSSPPSMPPPVPPRLGRAAPVRTPSLDSREAFEVDCYTIKEENGEEDFLT